MARIRTTRLAGRPLVAEGRPRPRISAPRAGYRVGALLLALVLGLLATLPASAATWTTHEVIANSIENSTQTNAYVAAAIDGSGTPYLVWRSGANTVNDSLRVARKVGATWSSYTSFTATQIGFGMGSIQGDTSLKVDSSGNLHLAFKAIATTPCCSQERGVFYGRYNGTAWTFEKIETSTHPNGFRNYDSPTLDLSSTGIPSIAFDFSNAESPRTYILKFATRASGSWVISDIDTVVSRPIRARARVISPPPAWVSTARATRTSRTCATPPVRTTTTT